MPIPSATGQHAITGGQAVKLSPAIGSSPPGRHRIRALGRLGLWLPGYHGYFGWGGVPYYGAYPYSLYGNYGHYGYGSIYNTRPYYYGYLVGVPYINYNNYSPVYYSDYSSLPSTTGTVTTQNLFRRLDSVGHRWLKSRYGASSQPYPSILCAKPEKQSIS